jgi:hypothetical protein
MLSPDVYRDMCVVQQPIDSRGGKSLRHEFVEASGMQLDDTATERRS